MEVAPGIWAQPAQIEERTKIVVWSTPGCCGPLQLISADYPYLVCTVDNLVAGYAYAHRHMERAAYQWNAELSIYLAPRFRGAGLGTALYTALIEILRQMHVRNAYGCVTLPNEGSAGLHKSMGFSLLGIFHHTGYKLGAWHDVGWFERPVCQGSEAPLPLLSVQNIPDGQINWDYQSLF